MKISHAWRIALSLAMILGLMAQAAPAFPKSDKGEKNDWPNWRGRNYDGVAPARNVFNFTKGNGLKTAWKKKLGSAYSSISISDGRAFTMFSDNTYDYLVAFEAKSGAELWRYKIDSTYIGQGGSHNGPSSTPLVDGNVVYSLGRKGQLFALEAKSGKKLWETHLVKEHHGLEPFHGFTTSPIVYGEILVLETGGTKANAISGFDKNSGKLLWAAGTDTVNYQSPIFASIAGQPHAPNSAFAQSVRQIENAQDKNNAVEQFMKSQSSFPIIENDKLAHFVYRGQVEDLAIMGDMFDLGQQFEMFRLPGTDLYYYTIEVEPDARLNYRFVKNFEQPIIDPLNSVSAGGFLGRFSELAMPRFKRPVHLAEPAGPRGTIDSLQFESKVIAGSRALQIYLPNGYANSGKRYPVVYVNYGQQALRMGKMANTLDNLIGKTIEPVIAVFIHAPNSFAEYARAQRDQYAQMVAQELVPFIDAKYRTLARPEARAFMGADEGGYAAFYATFKYPGTFTHVGGQSTHLFPSESEALQNMIKASKKLDLNIYLDWGTYDHRSAGSFNWAEFNSAFARLLEEQGYKISGGQVHDGFDWASWRSRTDRVLETFCALAKKAN